MMITETLEILREVSSKHAAGQIEPQTVDGIVQKAAVIGNTAEEFITQNVHHAVAQHALRKAEKDAQREE